MSHVIERIARAPSTLIVTWFPARVLIDLVIRDGRDHQIIAKPYSAWCCPELVPILANPNALPELETTNANTALQARNKAVVEQVNKDEAILPQGIKFVSPPAWRDGQEVGLFFLSATTWSRLQPTGIKRYSEPKLRTSFPS